MVFDKIKNAITGNSDADLGDLGGQAGLGAYGQYLQGVNFPVSKDELMVQLQENGAADGVIEHVRSLAADHFNSGEDVFKNLLNR